MTVKKCDCEAIHIDIVEKIRPNIPKEKELEDLSALFKIIADKTRIKLLSALDNHQMCVCDLAYLLDMTKSAVSHQLKTLKNAKLVRFEKKGKHVFYSLDDNHVKMLFEKALEHITE